MGQDVVSDAWSCAVFCDTSSERVCEIGFETVSAKDCL